MKKQRTFTSAFKAKIALELVKGAKTMQQISKESEVHTTQLVKWKNTLVNNASTVFEKNDIDQISKLKLEFAEKERKYHEIIGKQAMEIEFLKKKYEQYCD